MPIAQKIAYSAIIIRKAKNGYVIEGHHGNHARSADQWAAKSSGEVLEIIGGLIDKAH